MRLISCAWSTSLASQILRCLTDSGLSLVTTKALAGLRRNLLTLAIAVITLVTTFLTELTSNAATFSITV